MKINYLEHKFLYTNEQKNLVEKLFSKDCYASGL